MKTLDISLMSGLFNREVFEKLQPMLKSFDVKMAVLLRKYDLAGKMADYVTIWEDYTVSEGNVRLSFDLDIQMPVDFIEEVKIEFTHSFTAPYRKG